MGSAQAKARGCSPRADNEDNEDDKDDADNEDNETETAEEEPHSHSPTNNIRRADSSIRWLALGPGKLGVADPARGMFCVMGSPLRGSQLSGGLACLAACRSGIADARLL